MNPLKTKLQDQSGGRILDVATGHGQFLTLLADSFGDFIEAVGIDTSESNIEIARRECGERFHLQVMDAENIDFADGYFDVVTIRHSLHHLANIDTVMVEMKRVLKPGGLFIVSEVFQSPESERENSQRHLHHWWSAVDRSQGGSHNETFTKSEILRISDQLNLTEITVFEYREEYENAKSKEILSYMLEKCEDNLKILRDNNGPEELIRRGVDLVAKFTEHGFTNESALYVLGHKAK